MLDPKSIPEERTRKSGESTPETPFDALMELDTQCSTADLFHACFR